MESATSAMSSAYSRSCRSNLLRHFLLLPTSSASSLKSTHRPQPEEPSRALQSTWLAQRAEGLVSESQCGFRSGRGCVDQVFTVRILAEKAREFNIPLYLCFVDLQKAYDSVNRQALWAVLRRHYSLPDKFVRILEELHKDTRGAVRADGRVSGEFNISNGVRQGDVLSPTLFNLFLDAVLCRHTHTHTHTDQVP